MHINIFSFALLHTEFRLFVRRHENYSSEKIYIIFSLNRKLIRFFIHFFNFSRSVIKILPDNIIRFLLIRFFNCLMSFDNGKLLFPHPRLLLQKSENMLGFILKHFNEIYYLVLRNRSILWVVFYVQHLSYDSVLQHFDWLHWSTHLFKPTILHSLIFYIFWYYYKLIFLIIRWFCYFAIFVFCLLYSIFIFSTLSSGYCTIKMNITFEWNLIIICMLE